MKVRKIIVGILKTNCYLVYNEEEMIVVDPGGSAKKIIKEIEGLGITPKYIVNTHSHPDHVLANKGVQRATGAKMIEKLKEGDEIKIGKEKLMVLHTPGHTEDSICLRGEGFLIGGDVLFIDGHGRTDLPGGSSKEMEKTLQRLKKDLPGETLIYPGHGDSFLMKDWRVNY